MDFDSVLLTSILEVCSEESTGTGETVLLVRQREPSFAPTMYSAWEREGQPLNPALRYELAVQRERIQRYRELTAVISARVPEAVPLKGLQVAGLYPPGIVRYMNDLDYVVPDQSTLWRLAALLVELEWNIESATFAKLEGELHIMVAFRRPNEDQYALPFGVEIATHVTLGNLAGVPSVIQLPSAWRVAEVKNLVMLLFERFEQRFRARDIIDAALQFEALGRGRFPLLAKEIRRLALWPEYAELRTLMSRAGFDDLPPSVPIGAVPVSRCRRAVRALRPLRRPVPAIACELQRRMMYDKFGRFDALVWAVAKKKLNPAWALDAGLLCFGLPVEGGAPGVHTASVHHRDAVCWVETPIGRFLLTPTIEIDEDALDSLPTAEPVPEDVAEHKS